MNICKVKNCGKKHEARGYCKSHYRSLLRYGNPIQVDVNKAIREQKAKIRESQHPKRTQFSRNGICSVSGCSSPIKSRRLCEKHYARMRRNNSLEIKSIERGSITTCLAVGCEKAHKTGGYCEIHYKNYRLTGSPHLPKVVRYCGVKNCNNTHQAKGLCMKHYNEWKKNLKEHGI